MTPFRIRLAEQNIEVFATCPETKDFCRDYLTDGTPDFSVTVTPEDIEAERLASYEVSMAELGHIVKYSVRYLETLAVYRKIAEVMPYRDTVLFHGSAISLDGEAYIFAAKSGTGKSTHARLWREVFGERTLMINDDKPLLKITNDGVLVYGTPWNGKHHLGNNVCVPLKALCKLNRGETNRIEKDSVINMYPAALAQTYLPKDETAARITLALIEKLLGKASLYRLYCNMDSEAAVVAYEGMKQ